MGVCHGVFRNSATIRSMEIDEFLKREGSNRVYITCYSNPESKLGESREFEVVVVGQKWSGKSTIMRHLKSIAIKPGDIDKCNPQGIDNAKPEGNDDGKPGGTDDGKPRGIDNGKPEGIVNTKPEGTDDGKQQGIDNTEPGDIDNTKPGGIDDGKSEGNDDGKPGVTDKCNPQGIDNAKPEGNDDGKLGGTDDGKPRGIDNGKPGGIDNAKPEGTDDGKQQGIDNTEPEDIDNTKPGSINDVKQGGTDDGKPRGIDNVKPEGIDNAKPEGIDDGKPGGTDDSKPGGTDDSKPGGTDDSKSGGTDGSKPGGIDDGNPRGISVVRYTSPPDVNMRIIDLDSNILRKKTIRLSFFEDVAAVIYITAISNYDQTDGEDADQNRLQESVKFFNTLCNRWFRYSAIFLVLNKKDLFAEKIKTTPLRTCFPEYTGSDDYDEAAAFVLSKFEAVDNRKDTRNIHSHLFSGANPENVKFLFEVVADVIGRPRSSCLLF